MSLFETLSDMSNGYNDTLDSGSYKFENPVTEPEPAPTVSLYNLLDHSPQDLRNLAIAVRNQVRDMEEIKFKLPDTYTSLCAWATILESAIKERHVIDSEAWAEKTAKEINETIK